MRLTSTKSLPSVVCFRRFLDLQLLEFDIADQSSFINKRLTAGEIEFLREERKAAVHRCVNGYNVGLPFLYASNPSYTLEHAPEDYKKLHESSRAGPYVGVKPAAAHH